MIYIPFKGWKNSKEGYVKLPGCILMILWHWALPSRTTNPWWFERLCLTNIFSAKGWLAGHTSWKLTWHWKTNHLKMYVLDVLLKWCDSYSLPWCCWWLKSCTSWYGTFPIIYSVLYMYIHIHPGGAGVLPSTSFRGVYICKNSPDTSLQRQDTAMDWTIDFVELPSGFLDKYIHGLDVPRRKLGSMVRINGL